jgi:hypothetical protein
MYNNVHITYNFCTFTEVKSAIRMCICLKMKTGDESVFSLSENEGALTAIQHIIHTTHFLFHLNDALSKHEKCTYENITSQSKDGI